MSDVPRFPGVRKPLNDFGAVRTDLQTGLLMIEIDLSSARSLAANTAEVLKIAGNSFYVDKASDVGAATVVFQDDSRLRPARVYVEPGFIARTPWTQLIIENIAQAGKVLRVFYGVDVDFVPGTSSTVNLTGTVNTQEFPFVYGASYRSITALAANTPETVFSAAANVNGARVWDLSFIHVNATAAASPAYLAKTSAPVSVVDGQAVLSADNQNASAAAHFCGARIQRPVWIPAGRGLYFISNIAESVGSRSALYTLL